MSKCKAQQENLAIEPTLQPINTSCSKGFEHEDVADDEYRHTITDQPNDANEIADIKLMREYNSAGNAVLDTATMTRTEHGLEIITRLAGCGGKVRLEIRHSVIRLLTFYVVFRVSQVTRYSVLSFERGCDLPPVFRAGSRMPTSMSIHR